MARIKKRIREIVIYKATNKITGDYYIGVTKQGLYLRQYRHHTDAMNWSRLYFHRALKKYGRKAFLWTVIKRFRSYDAALKEEVSLISLLMPAYNIIHGKGKGTGFGNKKVMCLETGEVYESVTEAAYECDVAVACVSQACTGKALSAARGKHFIFYEIPLSEKQRKAIILRLKRKLAKKRSWNTLYPNRGRLPIRSTGKKDTLGRSKAGPMTNAKKVICLDDGRRFASASSAARYYGTVPNAVSAVCAKAPLRNTAAGMRFAYLEAA